MSGGGRLPRITLVLGGARSGKSAFAEGMIESVLGDAYEGAVYLATARAGDAEMAARIDEHRRRRGDAWRTLEEPLDLAGALLSSTGTGVPVLADCLTLWLTNIMEAGRDVDAETQALVAALQDAGGPVVLVSNEVGLGIVPDNALARDFRDRAGRLNQHVAAIAGRVVFVAAGVALTLKDGD